MLWMLIGWRILLGKRVLMLREFQLDYPRILSLSPLQRKRRNEMLTSSSHHPFSKKGVTEIVDLDMDHNIGK